MLNFAIAELVEHFQDFRPGADTHTFVDLFVGFDGHYEFKLFGSHFAFLGTPPIVTPAPAGSAAALKSAVRAPLCDAFFWSFEGFIRHAAIEAGAPIDDALAAIGTRFFLQFFLFERIRIDVHIQRPPIDNRRGGAVT